MSCKHTWTVSVYTEAGEEFSRRCGDCGEQMSLGWAAPIVEDATMRVEYHAAWLIAWIASGEARMTNSEEDGYHNSVSQFACGRPWYAGWLARAWVDHEELQRWPSTIAEIVADLESAGGTDGTP